MRIKRYTYEERQALVAKYRMEGNPPLTVFAKENRIAYVTLKRFIDEVEGINTDVAPTPQPQRVERAGSLRESSSVASSYLTMRKTCTSAGLKTG